VKYIADQNLIEDICGRDPSPAFAGFGVVGAVNHGFAKGFTRGFMLPPAFAG